MSRLFAPEPLAPTMPGHDFGIAADWRFLTVLPNRFKPGRRSRGSRRCGNLALSLTIC